MNGRCVPVNLLEARSGTDATFDSMATGGAEHSTDFNDPAFAHALGNLGGKRAHSNFATSPSKVGSGSPSPKTARVESGQAGSPQGNGQPAQAPGGPGTSNIATTRLLAHDESLAFLNTAKQDLSRAMSAAKTLLTPFTSDPHTALEFADYIQVLELEVQVGAAVMDGTIIDEEELCILESYVNSRTVRTCWESFCAEWWL